MLAAALRPIYAAASEEAARQALQDFAEGPWGVKYQTIVQSRQRAWEHVVPFYVFPPEIRRVVYTTNAIEIMIAAARFPARSEPANNQFEARPGFVKNPPHLGLSC